MISDYMKIMFAVLFAGKVLGMANISWAVVLAPVLIDIALHMIVRNAIANMQEYEEEEDDREAE